jgi:hypothetical protein
MPDPEPPDSCIGLDGSFCLVACYHGRVFFWSASAEGDSSVLRRIGILPSPIGIRLCGRGRSVHADNTYDKGFSADTSSQHFIPRRKMTACHGRQRCVKGQYYTVCRMADRFLNLVVVGRISLVRARDW